MPKVLICCLLLLFTSQALHAQRSLRVPWAKRPPRTTLAGKANLTNINISYQLDKRIAQTFEQAIQAQKHLPANYNFVVGGPIQETFKESKLNPRELYPEQTFLKNSEQTGQYLASRNNRLVLREVKRVNQILAQIDQNLTRLRQEAANTPQPQDPVVWLAQNIPVQINQLFIGESHSYEKIREFVTHFLPQLRAQFPQREIILFTEFLPENFKWIGKPIRGVKFPDTLREYFPVWDAALKAQIQVIGLEPLDVIEGPCEVRYLNEQHKWRVDKIWGSLEGLRLRNERWQKTLATYRKQHPNALFVVYSGAGHSLYNGPFSLATPDPQTFVTALYPSKDTDLESFPPFSSRMVATTSRPVVSEELAAPCEVVQWKSPDLPAITGFDVRIKWPIK